MYFGITNLKSKIHSFWIVAVWNFKFGFWTPCTWLQFAEVISIFEMILDMNSKWQFKEQFGIFWALFVWHLQNCRVKLWWRYHFTLAFWVLISVTKFWVCWYFLEITFRTSTTMSKNMLLITGWLQIETVVMNCNWNSFPIHQAMVFFHWNGLDLHQKGKHHWGHLHLGS